MRLFLGILLLLAIAFNGNTQTRKENTFRYIHRYAPLIAHNSDKSVYIVNRSPYDQNNNSELCPSGYMENKNGGQYVIEFRTSKIMPVMNNDGTVKMSIMLMYYTYYVTVKVYDENGNLLEEKELTQDAQLNTLYIPESIDVMQVHMGDNFTIADYINDSTEVIYSTSTAHAKTWLNYAFNGKRDTDTFFVYSARAKQGYNYKEMDYAASTFKSVMQTHNTNKEDTSKFNKSVRACISVWENELLQANYKDNGARINKEVAMGLHYNLALAYFVLGDYNKAYTNIHTTYTKEVDHHQQLRPYTDFEKKAMSLERTILLFHDIHSDYLLAEY